MIRRQEIFRCLLKGKACATCEERPFCMDIEVVLAKKHFERELFEKIIQSDVDKKGKK